MFFLCSAYARPYAQVASFDGVSLRAQLALAFAADVLVAVDGTALANAPFMRPGSGVVALGRECSRDRPCYWDCACRLLRARGPNWYTWLFDAHAHKPATPAAAEAAAYGAGNLVSSSRSNGDNDDPQGCTPAFANRLCAELWRPHLETTYLETAPGPADAMDPDPSLVAAAVRGHARRLLQLRHREALAKVASAGPETATEATAADEAARSTGGWN
jgi:hypothetical protein